MSTLQNFNTTDTWQELTGVTSKSGDFVIQTTGKYDVLMFVGEDPNTSPNSTIKIDRFGGNSLPFLYKGAGEKVWVKSTLDSILSVMEVASTGGFGLDVSQGRVPGYSVVDKFGLNPLITTGTDPEDVWEYGGVYQFTNTAGATYYMSSSNAGDTQVLEFDVLTVDSNGNWNNEVFTQQLNGQTQTALTPPSGDPIVRIFRIENDGNAGDDIAGTVYTYENDTVVGGVPQGGNATIRAIIDNGNNQTQMAIYTIPTGKVGFLFQGEIGLEFAGSAGAGTNYARCEYRSARTGKVFKTKKTISLTNTGTNVYQNPRLFPDPIPAKTDFKIEVKEVSDDIGIWATFCVLLVDEDLLSDSYLNAIGQIRRVN